MKQYLINKKKDWAKAVSADHMYQVFLSFSYDQIFLFEGIEFSLMQMREDYLKQEQKMQDGDQTTENEAITDSYVGDPSELNDSYKAVSVHHSDSSAVMMRQYNDEKNR